MLSPHEARSLIERWKVREALAALEKATGGECGNPALLEIHADLLLKIERPREAARLFARALRAQPTSENAFLGLLDALRALGRRRLASRLGFAALASSVSADAAATRCRILFRMGAYEAAEREARQAESDDREAAHILASILIRRRQLHEARELLIRIAESDGEALARDGMTDALRGRVEALLKNEAAARAFLQKATEYRPFDGKNWLRLLRLCYAGGDGVRMKHALKGAETSLGFQARALLAIGWFHLRTRRRASAALNVTQRVLRQDEANVGAQVLMAYSLIELGQIEEAEGCLASSGLSQSATGAVRAAIAFRRLEGELVAALHDGDDGKVAGLLADARREAVAEPRFYLDIARLLCRKRLYDEIVALLSRLDDARVPPLCNLYLGIARFKQHRHQEAHGALVRAARAEPSNPEVRRWLHIVERALSSGTPADDPFRYDPLVARPKRSLLDNVLEHALIVRALILRETRTRYGRQRLGYMMAVIEPMVMLTVMLFILRYIRDRQPAGMSLELFVLTGVMGMRFFMKIMSQTSHAMRANRQLLLFPRVTPFDARIARAALEMLTLTIVTILFGLALHLGGGRISIDQPLHVMACVLIMCLIGLAGGIIIENLRPIWRSVDVVVGPMNRFLFITSGVFFSVHDLPESIRKYALLNPLLHLLENIRHGAQASFPMHGTTMSYPLTVGFSLLLVAFLMDVRLRKRAFEH